MVAKKGYRKAKMPERQFVLRIPEYQAVFLGRLVEMGVHKSVNDSIVKLIDAYMADMERAADGAST